MVRQARIFHEQPLLARRQSAARLLFHRTAHPSPSTDPGIIRPREGSVGPGIPQVSDLTGIFVFLANNTDPCCVLKLIVIPESFC